MTREESIKYLKEMKDECNDTIHKVRYVTQEEVLDMAIKALEQEPSGDLISREDTLTAFADYVGSGMSMDDYDALWNIVTKMPSVNPQEPKWDRLYSWLNDMRLGIAPDETTPDDERRERQAQVDLLDEIMEWMLEPGK